jgi:hypothetical protein
MNHLQEAKDNVTKEYGSTRNDFHYNLYAGVNALIAIAEGQANNAVMFDILFDGLNTNLERIAEQLERMTSNKSPKGYCINCTEYEKYGFCNLHATATLDVFGCDLFDSKEDK